MKKLVYLVAFTIIFYSCSKENSDSFFPYTNNPVNDTAWSQQIPANSEAALLMESLITAPHSESFIGANGGVLNFPENLQLTFAPSSLRFPNGNICTGTVKVDVVQLRKKGDMVRFSRPTTSYGRLLETGGAFFIRASNNAQELLLDSAAYVKIKYRSPSPSPMMTLFYGQFNLTPPLPQGTNPGFTWVPANDSSIVSIFQQQDSTGSITRGYELLSQQLRWLNCNYFYDSTLPSTRLDVILPPNFTNTNTNVFAVFNNDNIVVQLTPHFNTRSFYAINIPVGKEVTIVTLSKLGDQLYLGRKVVTTTPNQPGMVQPELKTKPQIEQYLQTL